MSQHLNKNLQKEIRTLPLKPGVYRYYDRYDNLLYIGKAKMLKNRVNSYFQNNKTHSQRIKLLVSQIDRLEYHVVSTEQEALLMEANLIHSLQPRYNIALKDDKSYTYVRITAGNVPTIFTTRRKFDPKSRYFGPYTKKYAISEILRTLRIIFPYCQEERSTGKPCNYVSIKQCDGICAGQESSQNYKEKIEQISNILAGHTESAKLWLKNKIELAVKTNNFALASLWRDRLNLLDETVIDQKVVLPQPQNIDIITLITKEENEGLQIGSVYIQNIRDGKIANVNNFLMSGSEEVGIEDDEITAANLTNPTLTFLERFLASYYSHKTDEIPVLVECFQEEEQ
jgi:excinuclease ABC subunit C